MTPVKFYVATPQGWVEWDSVVSLVPRVGDNVDRIVAAVPHSYVVEAVTWQFMEDTLLRVDVRMRVTA